MKEKRYNEIDNITRFSIDYQKRNQTGNRRPGVSTTVQSICACIKHRAIVGVTCLTPILSRGEQIYKVTRRIRTIENQVWYRQERWRPGCFRLYLERTETEELIIYPFTEAIKLGPKRVSAKRESLGEEAYAQLQKLQSSLRAYTTRLKKYRNNPKPTQKTLAAMANSEFKITHITAQIEGVLKWQKSTVQPLTPKIEEPSPTPLSQEDLPLTPYQLQGEPMRGPETWKKVPPKSLN